MRKPSAPSWSLWMTHALVACGPSVLPDSSTNESSAGTTRGPSSDMGESPESTASEGSNDSGSSTTTGGTTNASTGPEPDLCSSETIEPCSTFLQDCPAGEKCTIGPACVPVSASPDGIYEPCISVGEVGDSCDIGLFCSFVDLRCIPLFACDATGYVCPDACSPCVRGETFGFCSQACNPLDGMPVQCPGDSFCQWIDGAFGCGGPVQSLAIGAPCASVEACGGAAFCAAGWPGCESAGCCAPYCDSTVPNACDAAGPGLECVPLGARCNETVGVCVAGK